ncbi:DUF6916 family protein [Kordiimonas sp.]|uniref:DUF6916 family protein n=1 Tax=Kordiimonas sp. TaxID=1970157 RepID=UPI003A952846
MLDKVTSKNFKDIVGTKATITIMDGPDIELTVQAVHEIKLTKDDERPDSCRKKPFSVVLSGTESHQAPDGSYDVTFEKIGLLEHVYVDNKSDNPESKDFNTKAAKEAAEAIKAAKKAAAAGKKADSDDDAAPPSEPEPSVLYEINFG